MGTLTGKQIDQTYDGLIKTNDEQPISGTLKTLQDGVGNDLPVQVSTTGVTFTGTVTGDNNTTYQIDATGDGNNIVLEFLASDLTQQDITLIPGTDITFSLLNPNEITINSTGAGTDTTYTLGVDESVPDGLITLQASDGSPIQEVVFQCDGNITMDTAVASNTLDVFVAPYDLTSSQDGADVDINLNSTFGGSNVTLEAGTNITLTNTGNNILIDAAGGTDTNTTYDFAASQVGANSKLALTGSDATIDAVTLVAGTNITLTTVGTDVTIDAAGGGATPVEFGSAYRNNQYSSTMGGYPSNTFVKTIQPVNGFPFLQQAIDQNDNVTIFSRLYGQVGDVMTTIVIPLFAGVATDVVVEWYRADPTTGLPGTRQYTETFAEPTGVETYYEFNLTTPQTIVETGDWWIGVRTSGDRKLAMMANDHAVSTFYTYGPYGTAVAGVVPINRVDYPIVPVPATIPSTESWSSRAELAAYFWK